MCVMNVYCSSHADNEPDLVRVVAALNHEMPTGISAIPNSVIYDSASF